MLLHLIGTSKQDRFTPFTLVFSSRRPWCFKSLFCGLRSHVCHLFTFELIHDYAKCSFHDWLSSCLAFIMSDFHHVWLSIRLNNLITYIKLTEQKNICYDLIDSSVKISTSDSRTATIFGSTAFTTTTTATTFPKMNLCPQRRFRICLHCPTFWRHPRTLGDIFG